MESVSINEIITFLDFIGEKYDFSGDRKAVIYGFSSLNNYKEGTVTWIKNENSSIDNAKKNIDLAIIQNGVDINVEADNIIVSSNSKSVFFAIIEKFYGTKEKHDFIGNNTYISPNVVLGKNIYIGHNCTLDGNITVGDNTVIYNNVNICNDVKIGSCCEIQSCTSIGHDGFGYTVDGNGLKKMIKHYGGVEVGDFVHIGANTTIARGTIDNTIIGENCKIDNLCHIAHNAILEPGVTLIAGTLIYGSARIKQNAYIASGIVRNQNKVGSNTVVGIGSVVTKDIEDNMIVVGVPAKNIVP